MPVTHGVTGSSPVRTAKEKDSSKRESFFSYIASAPLSLLLLIHHILCKYKNAKTQRKPIFIWNIIRYLIINFAKPLHFLCKRDKKGILRAVWCHLTPFFAQNRFLLQQRLAVRCWTKFSMTLWRPKANNAPPPSSWTCFRICQRRGTAKVAVRAEICDWARAKHQACLNVMPSVSKLNKVKRVEQDEKDETHPWNKNVKICEF